MPNYFEPEWVAPRYADARPDVHVAVVDELRPFLAGARVETALDVGCGTGLSTRPLARVARRVLGLDLSPSMLREAHRAGGASFVRGRAESLPFSEAALDVVTIGCAYHWCDPEAFLGETVRVLRPGGHLLLYDNYCFADSPRSTALFDWLQSVHWPRLPRTPRNPPPEPGVSPHPELELLESRVLDSWVPMSRESLITYLTTQSGAIAAVETGALTLEALEASLREGLTGRVPEGGTEVHFAGPFWLLRRRA